MKYTNVYTLLVMCCFAATTLTAQQPVTFTNKGFLLNPVIGFTYSDCAVDMNGDFLDDVVRVSSTALIIDYQQPDGSFLQTQFPINFEVQPDWSICAGDLDNNGFNDLLFGGGQAVSFVMANGDGSAYTETKMPGYIFSQRSTMADIDNNGWLDAFVCHDVSQSHPYRNLGNGVMQLDQTLIVTANRPGNYAAIWTDYDNDGNMDLYITKCKGGAPPGDIDRTNLLYRNNGDGTFSEVGAIAGLDDNAQSWSTVFEDFDNDGDFDAFIVNHDFQNRLLRNNGDGTFTDVIAGSGINAFDLGAWENASGDFNNDGYMDIFSELLNKFYLGKGDLTFVGQNAPVTPGGIGDFNNDGFLDVIRGNQLWINDGNSNNWLKINTIGIQSNRNGIGSRVEIYGTWGIQVREVRSGESFSPMNSLTTHFGIGQADHVDSLVIRWPSGVVTSVVNPAINTTHNLPEATCLLPNSELAINGTTALCPGTSVELIAPDGFSYAWSNNSTAQSITVSEAGNYSAVLTDDVGCVSFTNTVIVSIVEDLPPAIALSGKPVFCEGGSVALTASHGTNPVWSNGMTGQVITISESGSYTVSVDALCAAGQLTSVPIAIEVQPAPAPVVTGASIVQGDSILLTASGENLHWYDQPTGGNLLGTGPSFQTPPLDMTATYYVESHHIYPGEIQSGGKPDNSGGGGIPAQGAFTFFNVWEPFTLLTVTVYVPNEAPSGMRTIQLVNADDVVLQETSVQLSQGQHTVELNFEVPVGNMLSLRCPQNNLFRNSSGVQYPYPIGDVGQMTTSFFGNNFYYYFYNWKIQKEGLTCISEREPVEVLVVSGLSISSPMPGLLAFPNPAGKEVFAMPNDTGPQPGTLRLFDMTGREIMNRPAKENQLVRLDTSHLPAGVYSLQYQTDGQVYLQKIVIE